MQPSYQLTRYPIGSIREIFTVSWPLILGLLSTSLMMFADRIFLANYSLEALNASATAGMAFFLFDIFPVVVAGMSEVFVGRLNGNDAKRDIGQSVWQMVWFSAAIGPLFWIFSWHLSPFIFFGSPLMELEREYFVINCYFSMIWCAVTALMGFYIGIGRSSVVMWVTVLGNIVNIVLDFFLIYGIGPFPELGVAGAAIATGISAIFQLVYLMVGFLSKSNHEIFKTRNWTLVPALLKANVSIGVPAGAAKFIEVLAHLIFIRAVSFAGEETLTIVAIVQSIYMLIAFFTEGLSKGVAAIVSNLIGARQWNDIGKVLKAATAQHFFLFTCLTLLLALFSKESVGIFLPSQEEFLLKQPHFMSGALTAMQWMCVFFLFDGLCWIIMGHLLAAQDTKFLFYASLFLNWVVCVIPTVIGMIYLKWGAQEAWIILGVSAIANFTIMFARYLSGYWRLNAESKATPVSTT